MYSTRCSAFSLNSALSATSESCSGVHDMAVPTCRKRCKPATVHASGERQRPSTFTFQISGLLPNDATAAQLRTCVTCSRRGSFRNPPAGWRSPIRIFSSLNAASVSSETLNLRMLSRTRSSPCWGHWRAQAAVILLNYCWSVFFKYCTAQKTSHACNK